MYLTKTLHVAVLASVCAISAMPAAAQEALFWTQTGPGGFMTFGPAYVMKANVDGSGVIQLVADSTKIKGPNGLEYGAGDLYWPDQQLGAVYRAEADGTLASRVPDTFDNVYDVSVANNKVYWVNGAGNDLKSVNLDGTGYLQIMTTLDFPVALQATSEYLYWADFNTKKIRRADLNGGNAVDLITVGLDSNPYDFEVTDSYIYYFGKSTSNAGGIWRADLDGSNRTELYVDNYFKKGIEVTDSFIYWTTYDYSSGSGKPAIARIDLNGLGRQNVILGQTGVAFHGVVVQSVPEPETWAMLLTGLGLVGFASRRRAMRNIPF